MVKHKIIINFIKKNIIIISILILSTFMRFTGFLYGLPDYPDPDEPVVISKAVNIFKGDLNPHFFNYPSLFLYINAIIVGCTNCVYHLLHTVGITQSHSYSILALLCNRTHL